MINLFFIGERRSFIIGVACLLYYIIMIRIIREHNRTLLDNIRLSILNRNISLRDPLTGLANRRRLDVFIEKLIPMATRTHLPFCVILFDVDHFKQYNDTEGHHAGDVLLTAVADIITEEIRDADLAVRFGGEEFLVILADADFATSVMIADRIRVEIETSTDCTISAGIAAHHGSENFDETLRKADKALYRAKRQCRRCGRPVAFQDYRSSQRRFAGRRGRCCQECIRRRPYDLTLFHRYAFGQIARLVNVGALDDGHMIG